jgi:hypothetical protein
MHVVHLIAVVADCEEDAIAAAEQAIEGYGNGDVWDWFEVGGRWDGLLNDKNALCYLESPDAFREAVANALKYRNNEFCNLRDKIAGTQITAEDIDDTNGFGLPIDPEKKAEVAENLNKSNKESKFAFDKLMEAKSLEHYHARQDLGFNAHMVGYYLRKLGTLAADYYCFDSYFYDGDYGSTSPDNLWERCGNDPGQQWLVVVDLHN